MVKSVYSAVRTNSLYKACFITVVESVYSAVRTDSLYKAGFYNSKVFTARYGLIPHIKQDFIVVVESIYSAVRNDSLQSLKG
jgi:hypothetical protein